jgi:glycerate dehydrogenase
MRGVFLDTSTVTDGDIDLGPINAALDACAFNTLTAPGDIAAAIRDANIVISNKAVLDAAAISTARKLKLICIAATGTNNVDLKAARAGNIDVCNVSAYATPSVVEHVFMLLLALNRRLTEHNAAVQRGDWQHATRFSMLDYPFRELHGRSLGIIGYGELGQAVATTARAFGMNVLVAERRGMPERPGRCALDTLLATADVISVHCPLTPATENLLDMAAFRKMRPNAIVINTARGGIVNEADLLAALQAGEIAAAGIDVLADEPPAAGSPLLTAQLPNLLVTPHVAWAAVNARQRLVDEIAGNIRAFIAGNPHNLVN